jgi:capsular exopolysaccharide synthesis family protein
VSVPGTGERSHLSVPAPGEGTAGESAGGVTPTKIWHALRRRWLVALPLAALLAALVGWGADSRAVPIYTARTLVQVGAPRHSILDDDGEHAESVSSQRTQIATVKSRLVRQAVVRDLAPQKLAVLRAQADPVGWLEKEIQADYTLAPEILRITMKGSNPDELVVLLNAVRDSYLREVINKDQSERRVRLAGLNELASREESALKDARQKLTDRAKFHGTRDFTELRAKYDHLTSQLRLLEDELERTGPGDPRADGSDSQPKGAGAPDPIAVEEALEKALAADASTAKLQKDVQGLERKRDDFEQHLVNYQNEPDYRKALDDLKVVQEKLERRREELRRQVTEPLRPAPLSRPPQPRVAGAGPIDGPRRQKQIADKKQAVAVLSKELTDLEAVRGEIAGHEEKLGRIRAKARPLEGEFPAPERARVLEEAVIVETPKWNQALKSVGAPAGATFLVVVGFITWLDLRRGRINSCADLEAARVRVIGALPSVGPAALPVPASPTPTSGGREHLQLTDAIDMTRAVLAPVVAATPGYVLAVTSAVAGEGKTILAGHLAVRFARSGLRTLLIDADVRRPQLHRLFGLAPGPGVGEWVTGAAESAAVMQSGPVPGLAVLPAGGCDPRTVSTLLDLRLPELLESVKRDYDVIVLDTAPLLSTPEALAASRTANGVVLSVMRDVSRVGDVLACTERLATVNARVLGAVVTGDAPPRYPSA